jgi:hypothetical protein
MNPNEHDCETRHADDLLEAAERALFDATARLQEALVVIDREGLNTSADTVERVRQWTALIRSGLNRLDARQSRPMLVRRGVLEA